MAGIGTTTLVSEDVVEIAGNFQAISLEVTAGDVQVTGNMRITWKKNGVTETIESTPVTISAASNKYVKFASSSNAIDYLKIDVQTGGACNIIIENLI